MRFWVDGVEHTLHIEKNTLLTATVTFQNNQQESDSITVEIISFDTLTKTIVFRGENKYYRARITQILTHPQRIVLFVFNTHQTVIINLSSPLQQPPRKTNFSKDSLSAPLHSFQEIITSPLAGKITAILISTGQKVHKNQPLIIIESMKMENEIRAPHDAIIKNIPIKEGDLIESGHIVVILAE